MRNAHPVITPRNGDLLTREELRAYLDVGRNRIPAIVSRFDLQPIENLFPFRSVWRQILGLEPCDPEQEALLREPLRPLGWVADQAGRGHSTVRAKVRNGRFEYPAPVVDLGDSDKVSRSKRWLAPQIRAAMRGEGIPSFRIIAPILHSRSGYSLSEIGLKSENQASIHNVFSKILHSNDRNSPKRWE